LASLEKKRKNLNELLLLNSDKRPIEGTNSNLFIFKEGKIFTPPLSEGPLMGCMRSLVLDHFAVEEVALNLKDIQTADEIFFTNCNGVRNVKKFGQFEGYNNIISKKVVEKLNSLI
jgi:branched-subunit amino acid aminotransferase/4-amino-4-deoxychorismate lyase